MQAPRLFVCIAILGLFSSAYADSILLSDSFNGPSVNAGLWTTILPFSDSSVTQSGGQLTTANRGILATNQSFTGAYDISGDFTMNSNLEHFNIALRSDLGVFLPQYQERSGLIVSFINDGQGISLQEFPNNPTNENDWNQVGTTSFNFVTGQTYFFNILDTGMAVDVSINGIDVLNGNSTFETGGQVALYSRELPGSSTTLDAITISSVPEMGSTIIYLAGAVLSLGLLRRFIFKVA